MSVGALLLFPGAGSSRTHASLVAIEKAVAPLPVVRADFPYRKAGRAAPDRPPVLIATVRIRKPRRSSPQRARPSEPARPRRTLDGRAHLLDGGGRRTSRGRAGADLAIRCTHPGKPEQLRVEHLPRVEVPCLFISGTSDPFGTPDGARARRPRRSRDASTHVWIQGGRPRAEGQGRRDRGRRREVDQVVEVGASTRLRPRG